MDNICWDWPILQSQLTRIHRTTMYGVETWCHFQLTMGRVVMGSPSCPLSPWLLSSSPVPWPESAWCPGLEVVPALSPVSSLARLLDNIRTMQRRRANRHVAPMFGGSCKNTYWKGYLDYRHRCYGQRQSFTPLMCLLLPSQVTFVQSYIHILLWPEHCVLSVLSSAEDTVIQQVRLSPFWCSSVSSHSVPRSARLATLLNGRFDAVILSLLAVIAGFHQFYTFSTKCIEKHHNLWNFVLCE